MTTILNQFDLHTRLFNNLLQEISDKESEQKMSDKSNHLKWIAGHLLSTRYSLCPLARININDPFIEFFGEGSKINDTSDYPLLDEIQTQWNGLSDTLRKGLSTLPEKLLSKETQFHLPSDDKTIRGLLGFLMHHEGYHLGQMSMLRGLVGKDKMSYSLSRK